MICPYCNNQAVWTQNKAIYGRNYGRSYMCYYCKPCNAYVGCHRNSRTPLGTMANAELRDFRKKAHAVFDPLWKERRHKKRHQLYAEISRHFGYEIHIAQSDIPQCKRIIDWCNKKKEALTVGAGEQKFVDRYEDLKESVREKLEKEEERRRKP